MLEILYTIITYHFLIHLEPQHEFNTQISIKPPYLLSISTSFSWLKLSLYVSVGLRYVTKSFNTTWRIESRNCVCVTLADPKLRAQTWASRVLFRVKWPKRIIRDEITLRTSVAIQYWTRKISLLLAALYRSAALHLLRFYFHAIHKHTTAACVCLFLSVSSDVSHSELCQISTIILFLYHSYHWLALFIVTKFNFFLLFAVL